MALQTIQVRRRFSLRLVIGLIVATLVVVAFAQLRPASTGPAPVRYATTIPYTTRSIHMPPHLLGPPVTGRRTLSSFPAFRTRGSGQLQPAP